VTRDKTFKLEELAAAAEVSPRTVRYYVQRGLLSAPEFRGRDTVYGEDHLARLRAIRKLQDQYLPLDAIQAELARRSRGELEKIAERPPPAPASPARGEALQRYVLAPGVELLVSERANEALVDEVKAAVERHMKGQRT
jgi:DNA-binding transcriptional MerR regulator